ncbi:conserved hypothetical protein [Treponema primitia ZAS-2]|uniref:Uncharacterized protein n=1 Tax=Treponema primitia (strain ATCC BAA-887 / DSM 12427 / ZAS-2) TaxID=545694 RepID=F5YN72_TREPZ|nr:DUF6675 family protein [Treponema primitia]AEF86118.1 conserved hypothetical protein [Treponema primitia ZAS-2]
MSLQFKRFSVLFLLLLLLLAVAGTSSSATLEELVGTDRAAALSGPEPITEAQLKDPQPRLIPMDAGLRRFVDEAMDALDPSLFVESLSLYKKPPSAAEPWTEAERNALYNETLAISTLAGIEYFSVSRNRMRTFYETSTVIDGPETKKPLTDPVYTTPPAELRIYARQKDLTFGDNIYQYTYYTRTDALIFVQENLSPMSVGPISVVRKNRLRSIIAVIDAGDSLLVYVASMAKAASFPGMNERAGRSFTNRAEAILTWFSVRAGTAFEKAKAGASS